jgi:hypothetical protein
MDFKQGKKRNFIFASILCSFFFERVPSLSPRVEITPHGLRDPSISWWTDVIVNVLNPHRIDLAKQEYTHLQRELEKEEEGDK